MFKASVFVLVGDKNNNTQDYIHSAIIHCAKPYAIVHLGPLSGSRSPPGGRQLLGRAAYLPAESACRLL